MSEITSVLLVTASMKTTVEMTTVRSAVGTYQQL
jgi:hypothetical protein